MPFTIQSDKFVKIFFLLLLQIDFEVARLTPYLKFHYLVHVYICLFDKAIDALRWMEIQFCALNELVSFHVNLKL